MTVCVSLFLTLVFLCPASDKVSLILGNNFACIQTYSSEIKNKNTRCLFWTLFQFTINLITYICILVNIGVFMMLYHIWFNYKINYHLLIVTDLHAQNYRLSRETRNLFSLFAHWLPCKIIDTIIFFFLAIDKTRLYYITNILVWSGVWSMVHPQWLELINATGGVGFRCWLKW